VNVTLWRDDVVLSRPVAAAHQRHDVRTRLYLRVESNGVEGFGEVAPQPFALNGDPGVSDVVAELRAFVLPQIAASHQREGEVPSWTRLARFAGSRAASPFAVALVEMALFDRELRASEDDVARLWPERFDTPTTSTVSLLDDDTPWVVDAEAARLRVKTAPGPLSALGRERLAGVNRPVLLDFNCSATNLADVLDQLADVSSLVRVDAVEQPFAPGNVVQHAELAGATEVAVSLDEGVRSRRDLEQIVRYGAASMVCVKPARVGGVANARTLVERARELGLRPYLGGFFESGLARGVHRRLARHCVEEPSDVGPVAARGVAECVEVPSGLGLAPSAAVLARSTVLEELAG
jgi:o-succinylbenzoate synthase